MKKPQKAKTEPADALGLLIQDDRRKYFRIRTDPAKPVYLEGEKDTYLIVEMSAGGVALEAGPFLKGKKYQGRLVIPDQGKTNWVTLAAVRPAWDDVIGAQIVDIMEEDREMIHSYVHRRQKEELQKEKEKRKKRTKSA